MWLKMQNCFSTSLTLIRLLKPLAAVELEGTYHSIELGSPSNRRYSQNWIIDDLRSHWGIYVTPFWATGHQVGADPTSVISREENHR
ncbi:hypothetical protein BJ138DRAFT_586735 [Hygrophoropsis aurantiaca]|uniref:Uncharacterized protein n=1 Tax=Hygrophoropsis aurantiaca TaxID=72124 RepID=A0ACB8A0S8_9AGAM|nr:hypothetical protein BJ138DRAFT_586735 [Hygrophoropsis aurantiaca]